MTEPNLTEMNTKVRFVRCPRCREVLLESAELTIYKCGGCNTILQAKIRKNDTNATEPCDHDTARTEKNELELVSDDNNDSSLNQQLGSVKSSEGDQNENFGVTNSDDIPISIELSCHENADSSPEAHVHIDTHDDDDDEGHLDKYRKTDKNDFEGSTESDEVQWPSSINELNRVENKSSSSLAEAVKEHDKINNYPLDQNNGDGKEFGKYSSELTCDEIEELSTGSETEMARHSKSRFIFNGSSPEKFLGSRFKDSSVHAPRSSTARSYYANEGRESSYNEIDYKIPNRRFNHFYSRGTQAGPSTYTYNKSFQQKSSEHHNHRSQGKPDYRESDKVELLRMVYELQKQLNRTLITKENPRLSSYNDHHLAPQRQVYGERYGYYSAQIPPRGICCRGPYQSSHLSTRQQHIVSDDRRRKDFNFDGKRLNKDHRVKRHVRPVAGGSPIIACYRCFEVLKVPSDFIVFRKRCHRLRCNACSEVLKFSLQNRIHIVRYIPDDMAAPPSESLIGMFQSKDKNAVDNVGPSTKMSKWEEEEESSEEIIPGKSSTLHSLMGYSSPSAVINR